jgi:hypothetical protein
LKNRDEQFSIQIPNQKPTRLNRPNSDSNYSIQDLQIYYKKFNDLDEFKFQFKLNKVLNIILSAFITIFGHFFINQSKFPKIYFMILSDFLE